MIGKELLTQLTNTGSKFIEADIIFITIDKDGKLIWLERGNELAGFEHIVSRHKEQFQKAFGICEDEIALHLYNAITNGTMISSHPSRVPGGLDRIYEYEGEYYTFVAMGSNGYIVTSFPVDK